MKTANTSQLPRRPYGRNGVTLSIIGFGGILVMNADPKDASRIVSEAVERGVNYFDVLRRTAMQNSNSVPPSSHIARTCSSPARPRNALARVPRVN